MTTGRARLVVQVAGVGSSLTEFEVAAAVLAVLVVDSSFVLPGLDAVPVVEASADRTAEASHYVEVQVFQSFLVIGSRPLLLSLLSC